VKKNVAPLPGSLFTQTLPPWVLHCLFANLESFRGWQASSPSFDFGCGSSRIHAEDFQRKDAKTQRRKDAKVRRRKGFGNLYWQSWVSPFGERKLPGRRRSDFAVSTLRLGFFAPQQGRIIVGREDFSSSPP